MNFLSLPFPSFSDAIVVVVVEICALLFFELVIIQGGGGGGCKSGFKERTTDSHLCSKPQVTRLGFCAVQKTKS